jgi:hypothetical protein
MTRSAFVINKMTFNFLGIWLFFDFQFYRLHEFSFTFADTTMH